MLKFSRGNSKLIKLSKYLGLTVAGFDLPAGHTCPAANLCLSMANPITGKITDGPNCEYRCYAATGEARSSNARKARWYNYNALLNAKTFDGMVALLWENIPYDVEVLRIHSSGDFFSKAYFQAWVEVARRMPAVDFFGYTKILPYVSAEKPDNFTLTYSYGGKMDDKLTSEPYARVVKNITEAIELGLPVSCVDNPVDDYDFVKARLSFALPIHGTQPARRKR